MKKALVRVFSSPLGKIARLGGLASVILSITNSAITLPTSYLVNDAHAQQSNANPEMPSVAALLLLIGLGLAIIQIRRRFVTQFQA